MRLTPDKTSSFIQNHSRPFRFPAPCCASFFSSVHLTHFLGFRSEDWNSRSLVLCLVTIFVFEVCFWIIVWLEDPNMANYKIYNRVRHLLICYLLLFDRIHDGMCLNRDIGPQHQKYSSIFNCTHGVLFYPCVHQTHLECLLLKRSFYLVSSDHRSQYLDELG